MGTLEGWPGLLGGSDGGCRSQACRALLRVDGVGASRRKSPRTEARWSRPVWAAEEMVPGVL